MAENAGMHIDVSVDDEGEDTYRPIIRLHTGRNIPVQEYTSTSVRWQEELTKDFNAFLSSASFLNLSSFDFVFSSNFKECDNMSS